VSTDARKTVVLLGTLDTKGHEYAFLRDRVREQGVDVILVDAGIMGDPLTEADVTRQEVARAAGHLLADVQAAGSRGAAVALMREGVREVVVRLLRELREEGMIRTGRDEIELLQPDRLHAETFPREV